MPPPVAVVSDIHANLPALQAVLADMAAFAPATIYNLGDTVGYGPDPEASVDWAREHAAVSLMGNHDAACVGQLGLEWFNPWAREAVEWTFARLGSDRRRWLAARPSTYRLVLGGLRILLAHGTPRHPVTEYISGDAAAQLLRDQDPGWDVCLVGHTHLMGVYTRSGYRPLFESTEIPLVTPCIVNAGSVGQPRDGRPEAGYVLVDADGGRLVVRRVAYAVQVTQQAILDAGLPSILAERLAVGR
ncbi:metallophosphoesterase family protein [Geochorda subterranea]|uniref:Metallophosphoesterase family protein n=1 Tax=Geochorda subterranea TaxID=3109564 RepID=A0ABZ1BQ05_9FIRM|nr:metallophosphoesterase family protein [Limnochorda sp. LNt]WRP14615.1 metallophosphoesterase family protein [Limnochorda sp. LNt]